MSTAQTPAPGAEHVRTAQASTRETIPLLPRVPSRILDLIESADPAVRDQAVDAWCENRSLDELLAASDELDAYRRRESNLYKRVRALFFIAAIHRYHLPARKELPRLGR